MEDSRMTIRGLVKGLEDAFDYINTRFYDGLVKRPVITISEGAKVRAMGWVTTAEVWHEGEQAAHELNIASDYLNRSFEEIVKTLCHEIVHLENIRNGVQDCARSGSRHNKHFRETAEKHGMVWLEPKDEQMKSYYEKYGFSDVDLTEDVKDEVYAALDFLKDELTMYRDKTEKNGKKKSSGVMKYMCPCCGCSCRATKEINIMCGDCNEIMIIA